MRTEDAREKEHLTMRARIQYQVQEMGTPRLTAAQIAILKDNARGGSGSGKAVEAILWELEQEGGISLEDVIRGKGGAERRGWREEARQWGLARGWRMPARTAPRGAPIPPAEAAMVELGSGWEGATDGLKLVWDRVITVDKERHTISGKGFALRKSNPDVLTTFQQAAKHPKGAALGVAQLGGVLQGNLGAIWVSPSCKLWSTLQNLNAAQGIAISEDAWMETLEGVTAVLEAITAARDSDPTIQWCVEQPATGDMQHLQTVQEILGSGTVVSGCAYGERKSGKQYRLWMSPATRSLLEFIKPTDPESLCQQCKEGVPHLQGYAPAAGSEQGRIKTPGLSGAAARNRVPPNLARHVGWAMRSAWEAANVGRRGGTWRQDYTL